MKKLIATIFAAPVIIALSTVPSASQADKATAIARLDMSGVPDLDRDSVRSVQRALEAKGFDSGSIDGIVGPLTRAAVRKFQGRYGMKATGEIDNQTLFALGRADLAVH